MLSFKSGSVSLNGSKEQHGGHGIGLQKRSPCKKKWLITSG